MPVKHSTFLPLLAGAFALLFFAQAQGVPEKGSSTKNTLTQTALAKTRTAASALSTRYTWHDAEGSHSLWLNPALLAEFGHQRQNGSAVQRVHPGARAEPGSGGKTRVWRLDGAADRVLQQVRAANPAGMYSPVFNDGPLDGARKRALPGGVIVRFKPEWTRLQISIWTASQGLSSGPVLGLGPNVYVLKTAPGLAALDIANRIHRSGDVVSAEPNWWVEAQTR